MNKLHLTEAQLALLAEFQTGILTRSQAEYETFQKRMLAVSPQIKRGSMYTNLIPGYEAGEVRPANNFDALRDLPAGVGVFSMWDGGGNHKVGSAGEIALRGSWNTR